MVVILVVTIRPQPIFLVIGRMAWYALVGVDRFDVSVNGLLLFDRR